MRKLLKSLKLLLIVVVVLIVIAAIAASLFANSAVRVAVETAGTKALSVGVELDAAKLSILTSSLSLRDLTVANPPGYQHETLLQLQDGDIEVRTKSLLTDEVLIKDIQLDGMDLVLEQRGLGNNLQDIIKAAKRGAGEPSGKKLYVDNLELKNVTVNVKLLPVPGKIDTVTLKLAPIKMTDLGRNETLDIATLTSKIILAVAAGIAEQGTGVLPKEMISGLTTVLDTALGLGKVILDTGVGATEGLQKGVEDIGKGVTEGIKGILKPKSDE
jgi:uncharacterized protein involved in outer membrane biogenesis